MSNIFFRRGSRLSAISSQKNGYRFSVIGSRRSIISKEAFNEGHKSFVTTLFSTYVSRLYEPI